VLVGFKESNNNNNNNNNYENVYCAVIMTKDIARVHPVHLMNVDWVAANSQTKPIDLDCESASSIAIVIITQPVG